MKSQNFAKQLSNPENIFRLDRQLSLSTRINWMGNMILKTKYDNILALI
jgi:hypothetical protein